MTRPAFSPIFNEGLDFTTVLLDKHGDAVLALTVAVSPCDHNSRNAD